MNRRETIRYLVAGGVAAAVLPGQALAAHHRSVTRVGVQLFTVRDQMSKDVAATLAAVAEVGYQEVETAGTGNLDAVQFATALADAGLTAPAAHVPINLLRDQPQNLLETADIIGYRYLVVPWLPPDMRTTGGYAAAIDTLNAFGELSAQAGIQTCYHNHAFEFESVDGAIPFDVMLENCDPELVKFELDLYWARHAGADALGYLQRAPERFPLCHVKDRTAAGEMTEIGSGDIDFPELFAAGTGLRHYFVEHDRPEDSMASIRRSFRAVSAMRF